MSVTAVPLRPIRKGSLTLLWLGLAVLVLAAAGMAWAGTAKQQETVTPSGLRFRVIQEGTGPKPTTADVVLINYTGRLENEKGRIFDSTEGKQPIPLPVGGSIPGFTEALQMMHKGGTYHIWIPSNLAYGANVPPGAPIPPNANLDFTVKLIDLAPLSALQGAMGGAPHGGM